MGQLIGPLGSVPFRIEPNEILDAYVVIQNKSIGHSLIPEVRDLYEAWVEFVVKDAHGKDIYHSGSLRPDGELDPRAHSFTNRPVDKDGAFVDNHQVQTFHSVAYDNTIQSGRSTLVRYRFRVPANIKGSITITAKINYRHFRQSYINNVLGEIHPAYPVVELASSTRTLKIGDNSPSPPAANGNPDWTRWNNLGIGYLDEFQYAAAVHAFLQVVRLRPDYADGYTNIALTEIEWEQFGPARKAIEKALLLSPNNARALYYRALLERRAGESDAELADLQEVVQQYPEARDARRELGITYFQRDDNENAMQQFQALEESIRTMLLHITIWRFSTEGWAGRNRLNGAGAAAHRKSRPRIVDQFSGISAHPSGHLRRKRAVAHSYGPAAEGQSLCQARAMMVHRLLSYSLLQSVRRRAEYLRIGCPPRSRRKSYAHKNDLTRADLSG